jgi:formylglycine-generating enzyme required for sulfatase activity
VGPAGPAGRGTLALAVTFNPWPTRTAKPLAVQTIDAVVAHVYSAAGAEVVSQSLQLAAGTASGRLNVAAAQALRVALVYLDGATVRYVGETSNVEVAAGDSTVVKIAEDYLGTSVTAPITVPVGQEYRVSWMARPHVTGYELQEATTVDFSGTAPTVYSGGDTAVTIAAKPTVGITYYYRARANTVYGFGPWHSAGTASTMAGPVGGTLIIDVPVPPDEPTAGLVANLPGGSTMDFLWMRAGTFAMGSPDTEVGRATNEGPQHQVTLTKGYWIGRMEVTQAQWQGVMGTGPWADITWVTPEPTSPAIYVSWDDAQALIHQLNLAAGDSLYRLPTEAEWEYACRAGTTAPWSFGDQATDLERYAWYEANTVNVGENASHRAGAKLANRWGLCDVHGNVAEWCQDYYGAYTAAAATDPTGPGTGTVRVLRGGGFRSTAQGTRSATRENHAADGRKHGNGVRLVRLR